MGAFDAVDIIQDFNITDGDALDVSDLLEEDNPLTDSISDFVQITDAGANSTISIDVDGGAYNFAQAAQVMNTAGLADEEALESSGVLITV